MDALWGDSQVSDDDLLVLATLQVAKVSKPDCVSSETLIILSFLWNYSALLCCSRQTTHIQRTISLSADVKQFFVWLDANHVLQLYNKFFSIQKLKMLPQFLIQIPQLVMIDNSCLNQLHNQPIFQSHHQSITVTLLASKHEFIPQSSFNSQAFFMNPEVAGLTKYWVYTNSFETNTTGPFNIPSQ